MAPPSLRRSHRRSRLQVVAQHLLLGPPSRAVAAAAGHPAQSPTPEPTVVDYHSQHPGLARHSSRYQGPAPLRHPSDRLEQYATMTPRERYLFDLQGFIIIRGLLSELEVGRMNAAFDANLDRRSDFGSTLIPPGCALSGSHGSLRQWVGLLSFPRPHCEPFRELLCHKKLIPYLNTLLGRGWRINYDDSLSSTAGCEGLRLHGFGNSEFIEGRYYLYNNGRLRCGMVNCQIYTTAVNPGDGGLVLVPGSHKANLFPTSELLDYEEDTECCFSPTIRPGDAVIFSENTTHGTLPWTASHERRCVLYRFTQKTTHYPSKPDMDPPSWLNELTEAQRAVLEPAYGYSRPLVEDNGVSLVSPEREGQEAPVRSSHDNSEH